MFGFILLIFSFLFVSVELYLPFLSQRSECLETELKSDELQRLYFEIDTVLHSQIKFSTFAEYFHRHAKSFDVLRLGNGSKLPD